MNLFKFLVPSAFILLIVLSGCQSDQQPSSSGFLDDWELFTTDQAQALGSEISQPDYKAPQDAYQVQLPATVMGALNREKVFGDIFMGTNLDEVDPTPFKKPWWYRKVFRLNRATDQFHRLVFEGLNHRANIWLNGQQLASADTTVGCFRMFEMDITASVAEGDNVLAVEVFPPKTGDLTIGFVDWNPWPPDNNMGLWRPVKLLTSGPVTLKDVFVKPNLNVETLAQADLDIYATLHNQTGSQQKGSLHLTISDTAPFAINYTLAPGEKKQIQVKKSLSNPRIWWPHHMGEQELYKLSAQFVVNEEVSDSLSAKFGIRKVEDHVNKAGHRGYKINGKELLITGGGWVDDIFLDDSDKKVWDQMNYVRHMGLNTIRLEGFWGKNKTIYEAADELGILIMIGWSCQWEWKDYCGRPEDEFLAIRTDEEIVEHAKAYQSQVEWLRNHPSVFLWVYGSDKLLVPKLETKLNEMIASEDGSRPILNSCGSAVSEVTGKSGVKMNGPYSYVTPNYWYEDNERGGAFGFNTETGPGIQPAPIESIRKMIPEDALWPINAHWNYHLGRREFATFEHWMPAFEARYGMEDDVERFALKSQMANYEAMRAMFEAFHVNRPNSTGIIQWMLNSAWPGMQWQLYDWYLMPNGAFYATRNACRPLNIAYNYANTGIYLTTQNPKEWKDIQVEVQMLNTDGEIIHKDRISVATLDDFSTKISELRGVTDLPGTYFLDLRLKAAGQEKDVVNFYWLSTEKDILDLENSEWFVTRNTAFADLSGINQLTLATVEASATFQEKANQVWMTAELTNTSDQVAFFIELGIRDETNGQSVLPVFLEDNYISLLPGEKRIVSGYVMKNDLGESKPTLSYQGWNLKR